MIRMNEIILFLACYGQELIFLFGNRDKDKDKLCERERRRWSLNKFEKVTFTIRLIQFLHVIIHK